MLISRAQEVEALIREISAAKEVFIDLEGRVAARGKGINPYDRSNFISGAAVKVPGGSAKYLPLRHPDSVNMPIKAFHDVVKIALARTIANHNLAFDSTMWHEHEGLPLPTKIRESMVAMQLENENHLGPSGSMKGAYALKHRARKMFGDDAVAAETGLTQMMLDRGLNPKADLWKLRADEIAPYACADVDLVDRVFEHLDPKLERLGISDLAREYYDYRALLTRMEVDGLWLDRGRCEEYLVEARANAAEKLDELSKLAGRAVNPGSAPQMQALLKAPTTAKWMVKRLALQGNQAAKTLLSWRRWAKAASTYYEPYLAFSDARGHCHPSFGFVRTGRLSMYDPNFHATPHYGPEYKCKDVFRAPPGFFLLNADWSQAEMRGCAHYTQDPWLTNIFEQGIDVHQDVASGLGIPRQTAKPINYGAAYGMGKRKLARELGCSEAEAERWLKAYHTKYVGPRALYRRMESLATAKGWIRLWDGRYRRLPAIEAYKASNSLLQGMVGAMARKAMLRLAPWVYGNGGFMWLQIHDSILFCLPESMQCPETYQTIRDAMEDFQFRVKIPVDMKVGRAWNPMRAVELKEAA